MRDGGVRAVVDDAARRLGVAGVSSPRVDAELLLAYVMGVERSRLLLADVPTDGQLAEFEALLQRRCAREPLQHLTGEAYFRHLTLAVGPGVFIPRPETETLVDLALAEIAELRRADSGAQIIVVDLCTGSGAIPLAIATEATAINVSAVELSPDAYRWATQNAIEHADQIAAAGSTLNIIQGDACEAATLLPAHVGKVDVVTCNPPYIPSGAIPRDPEVRDFDPHLALFGGVDGLDVVRGVVDQAAQHLLRPGGLLLVEHGDEQGDAGGVLGVPDLLRATPHFTNVLDHYDLSARPRITEARKIH